MAEKQNTPEIRFEGFTDPWEQRKLSEVATFGGGHTPSMADSDNYEDGCVLWVTSQDVKSSYLDRTTTQITEKGAKKLTLYPAGSLVMVTRSGILRHTLPVAELRKPSTVNQDIRVILPQDTCCGGWLLQFFISRNKELLLEFGKTGTTVESVDFGKIKDMLLRMPSSVEQQQIGRYFAQLDSLITLHQRKHDKLCTLKKSMLDKMFPKPGETEPEIRFEGFTDPWEQRKWSEYVSISTDMVDPRSGNYDNLPHVGPGNMESFTGRLYDNVNTVKDDALISGKFHFNPGDIIYGKINPQLGKYTYAQFEGLASADAYVLNGKNGLTQEFLFGILQTKAFFDYSVSVSMRSGMPKINRDELNAFEFLAPNESEQRAIGDILLKLDDLITLHQRKLELLRNIKKSLLDRMFV